MDRIQPIVFLALLAACITALAQEPAVPEQKADDVACTMQYDPVCGADGTTYSNECVATATGVDVATLGECPPPAAEECPEEAYPVCGAGWRYLRNECLALAAGTEACWKAPARQKNSNALPTRNRCAASMATLIPTPAWPHKAV